MIVIKANTYVLLYANFLLLSLASVLAKLAGNHGLMSITALTLYGSSFILMGVYAVLWQVVLKRLPLTVAYTNKAVSIILGMLWGALLFNETISWRMVIGAMCIILGVILVVKNNES